MRALVLVLMCAACFEEPNYEGRLCAASEPCPTGWICGAEGRCHLIEPLADATVVVVEDARVAAEDARVDEDAGADPPDADAPPPDAGTLREVTVAVITGLDDAMEGPPMGETLPQYAWISCYSEDHWGGLRFRLTDVGPNDRIVSATLEVYIDSEGEDNPDADLYLQDTDGPAAFGVGPNDIASRPRASAPVGWTAADLGAGWHLSPPITSLVQTAVNRAGWTAGSPIVFIIHQRMSMGFFEVRQFDHPPAGSFAARLHVTYSPQ